MKKIFLTLSVIVASLAKGVAQEADLQAFVVFDTLDMSSGYWLTDTVDRANDRDVSLYLGQTPTNAFAYLTPNASSDSIFMWMGGWNNGPDPIDANATISYQNSWGRYLTAEECIAQGVTCSDTERYWWTWSSNVGTDPVSDNDYAFITALRAERFRVDSIGLLMDWNKWVDSAIYDPLGPPYETFEPGKVYGVFMRIYGVGPSNATTNIDTRPRNNIYVHKIKWMGTGMSIKDMLVKRKTEALEVYPNPAKNEINFNYEFKQNSVGDLIIKDMTGRTVAMKNFGRQQAGKQSFKYDVSNLAVGNYIAEFQTGETIAVSKFTVNK